MPYRLMSRWLNRIGGLFKQKPRIGDAVAVLPEAPADPGEWQNAMPAAPGIQGIKVQEVSHEEFLHEWSRTVAEEASASEAAALNERRLPGFDRRLPNRDRRTGNGHDRRAAR